MINDFYWDTVATGWFVMAMAMMPMAHLRSPLAYDCHFRSGCSFSDEIVVKPCSCRVGNLPFFGAHTWISSFIVIRNPLFPNAPSGPSQKHGVCHLYRVVYRWLPLEHGLKCRDGDEMSLCSSVACWTFKRFHQRGAENNVPTHQPGPARPAVYQ